MRDVLGEKLSDILGYTYGIGYNGGYTYNTFKIFNPYWAFESDTYKPSFESWYQNATQGIYFGIMRAGWIKCVFGYKDNSGSGFFCYIDSSGLRDFCGIANGIFSWKL